MYPGTMKLSRGPAASLALSTLAIAVTACANVVVDAGPEGPAEEAVDAGASADAGSPCAALDAVVDWSACSADVRTGYAQACFGAAENAGCASEGEAAYGCLAGTHRTCSESSYPGGSVASLSAPECASVFAPLERCLAGCPALYSCDSGACQCDPSGPNAGAACAGAPSAPSPLPTCPSLCAQCSE